MLSNNSSTHSRLYGLYIHNLTKKPDRDIALDTVNKFLMEKPPFNYEYGDVVVLEPHNEVGKIVSDILSQHGFIIQFIAPNQLYTLMDRLVMHYLFTNDFISQDKSEKFIYDWEISNRLTLADLRHTRYIRTYFVK